MAEINSLGIDDLELRFCVGFCDFYNRTTGLVSQVVLSNVIKRLDSIGRQNNLQNHVIALEPYTVTAVSRQSGVGEQVLEVTQFLGFNSAGEEIVKSVQGSGVGEFGVYGNSDSIFLALVVKLETVGNVETVVFIVVDTVVRVVVQLDQSGFAELVLLRKMTSSVCSVERGRSAEEGFLVQTFAETVLQCLTVEYSGDLLRSHITIRKESKGEVSIALTFS